MITNAGTGAAATVTVKGFGGNLTGTGAPTGASLSTRAQITANGGAVLVEGTGGGAGTSGNNYGVWVLQGGVITNAGTGAAATVTVKGFGGNLTGTGGSNFGVYVSGTNTQIRSSGGAVLVEGTGGSGASSPAIRMEISGQVVGTTGTPTVTLTGDSMEFLSTPSINAGTNPVVLKPRHGGDAHRSRRGRRADGQSAHAGADRYGTGSGHSGYADHWRQHQRNDHRHHRYYASGQHEYEPGKRRRCPYQRRPGRYGRRNIVPRPRRFAFCGQADQIVNRCHGQHTLIRQRSRDRDQRHYR